MADQLRYDLIGSAHTPHLNALLGESCFFPRGYCGSPLCAPARGAFFTGRYPNETGCLINPWAPEDAAHGVVKSGTPNLYSMLEQDWDAWHAGKQHFFTGEKIDHAEGTRTHWLPFDGSYGPALRAAGVRKPGGPAFAGMTPQVQGNGTTRMKRYSTPATGCYEPGFEHFFDAHIVRSALEAVERRDRAKPFFLSTMFLAPHPPLEIPDPWFSRVREVELPENVGRWSPAQSPLQLYHLPGYIGTRYSREEWREVWRVYAGLVSLLDDCVGMLVEKLKAEGLYDDALIVFLSDHGEMLGSHCLWQKMCHYEESSRTPIVFKPPASAPCQRHCDDLISQVDVLPTLCDYLGIEAPPGLPGRSARGAIEGREPLGREEVFVQFDGNGALGNYSRCVVRGRHKLIVDLFKDEIFFELYDLEADPQEDRNLAFDEPEWVAELLGALTTHMRETGDRLAISPEDYTQFTERYRTLTTARR